MDAVSSWAIWLQSAAQTVIVLSFAGAVFSYIVLRPLNSAIEELKKMILESRAESRAREERLQLIDLRVVKCEESAKSAHHRIDRLEGRDDR